jgi:hypothetical protein
MLANLPIPRMERSEFPVNATRLPVRYVKRLGDVFGFNFGRVKRLWQLPQIDDIIRLLLRLRRSVLLSGSRGLGKRFILILILILLLLILLVLHSGLPIANCRLL